MFQDPGLRGKVVVITGGSRGLGRELVLRFAEEGCRVVFTYRADAQAAAQTVALARELGLEPQSHQADARDSGACERVAAAAVERHGRIDVLVNNAAVVRDNLMAAFSDEEIRDVLDTNILGVLRSIQAVVPQMMVQRAGRIINISSVSATRGGRGQSNYAASKGAVEALTRSLAVELAPKRITVNAVAPGVLQTDMSKDLLDAAGDEVIGKILLGRLGRPEDVAPSVLFLASRFAEYITGQVLHVDGGFKMA